MSKRLFVLLALALASSAASAAGDNAKQQGSGGDAKQPSSTASAAGDKAKQQVSGGDAKRQEMFLKMKQARVSAISDRIAGMQTVLGCTNAATSFEQMKSCIPQQSGGGSPQAKPCN